MLLHIIVGLHLFSVVGGTSSFFMEVVGSDQSSCQTVTARDVMKAKVGHLVLLPTFMKLNPNKGNLGRNWRTVVGPRVLSATLFRKATMDDNVQCKERQGYWVKRSGGFFSLLFVSIMSMNFYENVPHLLILLPPHLCHIISNRLLEISESVTSTLRASGLLSAVVVGVVYWFI